MENHIYSSNESFVSRFQQVAFDFEASPMVMQAVDHDRKRASAEYVDDFHKTMDSDCSDNEPSEDSADPFTLHQGRYLELALALLDTCAADLMQVKKVLENPASTPLKQRRAKELQMKTVLWLREEIDDCSVTFQDCALLLEQELRLQSLDEIELPEIYKNRDKLADWIIGNPDEAHRYLKFYMGIFAPDSVDLNDYDEDTEQACHPDETLMAQMSECNNTQSQRSMARARG